MKKPSYPYRKFLSGVVKTRKYLLKSGRSMKRASHIPSTIMRAEDLLNRMPSEATVQKWLRQNYALVRDLIPAKHSTDKRFETLNKIVNA